MEVRGQLTGTDSLLPPRRFQRLEAGHQAWWQDLLPVEPSRQLEEHCRFKTQTKEHERVLEDKKKKKVRKQNLLLGTPERNVELDDTLIVILSPLQIP